MIPRTRLVRISLCLTIGASVTGAHAATYNVVACDAAPDGTTNNAWTYSESATGRFQHGDGCAAPSGTEYAGLYLREDLSQNSNIPPGTNAYWTFTPPPGTKVTAFAYLRHLRTYLDDGWRAELRTDSGVLEDCVVPPMGDECDRGETGGTSTSFEGLSATNLQFGARCAPIAPSTSCTDGSSLQRVSATASSLAVTVDDPEAPVVGSLSGTLIGGGWLGGTQTVSFSAQDATGIDRLELVRDGAVVLADDRPCDYTRPAPCANPSANTTASWTSVDTAAWPDGTHAVTARASDAAGNASTSAALSAHIDNSPPGAPMLSADSAWSAASDASWSWSVPEEADRAPIDRVELETCRDASCDATQLPPTPGPVTFSRSVEEGSTTLRVRHRDAAGNQGDWSAPVMVRRDRSTPAAPRLGAPRRDAKGRYRTSVTTSDTGPAPIVKLAGRACPRTGNGCRELTADGSSVVTGKLTPGRWSLTVHAVDAAGNVGADAEVKITVPRRPPHLKLTSVRVTRSRVVARGRLATAATGSVRVIVAASGHSRTRTVEVGHGGFRVAIRRPGRASRRLRLKVRYLGDAQYRPASRTRVVRLPASSRRGAGDDPSAPPSLVQP